jgi:hypothetical protein
MSRIFGKAKGKKIQSSQRFIQAAAAAGPIHDFYQTLLTIAAC